MARAGAAEYHHSIHGPHQRDQYYREVITHACWDHPYHPLRERTHIPSCKEWMSSSREDQSKPWALMSRSFTMGKDDLGASYLDGRQMPRGLSSSRAVDLTQRVPRIGLDPRVRNAQSLTRGLRASASSGALPMAAKFAATRGDMASAGREGRASATPSVRSRVSSAAGWAISQHEVHGAEMPRTRMPSFARIHGT
mmetsp:Transcript_75715/g.212265  ORF Transcript_75715/g.212265 Transcript_75715/m.212265 type:complete len:196 (+) Transcript_75715:58-645(+)